MQSMHFIASDQVINIDKRDDFATSEPSYYVLDFQELEEMERHAF